MMKTLKAPAGCGSASVEGHTIDIVDGVCEVDARVANELYSHGFTDVTTLNDPRPPADEALPTADEVMKASIRRMTRPELFALAKQNEVALTAKMTTEAMREAMVDHFTRSRHGGLERVEEPVKPVIQPNADDSFGPKAT